MGQITEPESRRALGGGCATAGCERPVKAKGLCKLCYGRKLRADGRLGQRAAGSWGKWRGVECATEGCSAPVRCGGFCLSCYNKSYWRAGTRRPTEAQKREGHLRHRYGISSETCDAMLAAQGGCCAICKQPPTEANTRAGRPPKLYVDHCHGTERVRGLLCNHCNLALGYAKSESVLRAAAEYLRRYDGSDC